MPLDPDPNPKGNVVITGTIQAGRDAGTPTVLVLRQGEAPLSGQTLYASHFQTCPNAGTHRKGNA